MIWRVCQNDDLLPCQFLLDKQRLMFGGFVMYQQSILAMPKLRTPDILNHVDSQWCLCKGACLQLLLMGWIPSGQFSSSQKTVQVSPCLLICPVAVFSFMVIITISRWPIVAKLRTIEKTPYFVSCYDPVEKHAIIISITGQVLQTVMQFSCLSCMKKHGTLCCVTRYMLWSSAEFFDMYYG